MQHINRAYPDYMMQTQIHLCKESVKCTNEKRKSSGVKNFSCL